MSFYVEIVYGHENLLVNGDCGSKVITVFA